MNERLEGEFISTTLTAPFLSPFLSDEHDYYLSKTERIVRYELVVQIESKDYQ